MLVQKAEWRAHLRLRYESNNNKTLLTHRLHEGPLVVQKSFYPEGPICHNYILHPPGGVAGGDSLTLDVDLASQTHVLLTTPAAGKFYRSSGAHACVNQNFNLASAATLEWLPQENIYFNASKVRQTNRFYLHADSRLIAWDMQCLGRIESGEFFLAGELHNSFTIYQNLVPLFTERNRVQGDSELLRNHVGYQGQTFCALLVAYPVTQKQLIMLRETSNEYLLSGLTLKRDLLVVRYLGDDVRHAQQFLRALWTKLRPMILGVPARPPRIWST